MDPFEGRCCGPTCDGCWLSAVSVYSTFANVFPLLPDTRPNAALRVLHIGPAVVLIVYSLTVCASEVFSVVDSVVTIVVDST